jgi:hypothetical protein
MNKFLFESGSEVNDKFMRVMSLLMEYQKLLGFPVASSNWGGLDWGRCIV